MDKKMKLNIKNKLIIAANKQRLIEGGREITDPEHEIFLINWIGSERIKKNKSIIFILLNLPKKL